MSMGRAAHKVHAANVNELASRHGAPAFKYGAFYFYFYYGSVNADCDSRVGA
jgi:hypothetical protein